MVYRVAVLVLLVGLHNLEWLTAHFWVLTPVILHLFLCQKYSPTFIQSCVLKIVSVFKSSLFVTYWEIIQIADLSSELQHLVKHRESIEEAELEIPPRATRLQKLSMNNAGEKAVLEHYSSNIEKVSDADFIQLVEHLHMSK